MKARKICTARGALSAQGTAALVAVEAAVLAGFLTVKAYKRGWLLGAS